jgi:hypothetical protein
MKRVDQIRWLTILGSFVLCVASAADDMLPKSMKGTISRFPNYNVSWSIQIESQETDGSVKGRFSFDGRRCRQDGLAFTGTYQDGTLQLSVPGVNAYCGPWEIKVKRTSARGYEFEGTSNESTNPSANAFLSGS